MADESYVPGSNDDPALNRDDNRQIVSRRGGWFVTGVEWSGPWATRKAADFALAGDYDTAHRAERERWCD